MITAKPLHVVPPTTHEKPGAGRLPAADWDYAHFDPQGWYRRRLWHERRMRINWWLLAAILFGVIFWMAVALMVTR